MFSSASQGQKPSCSFLHGFYGWLALWSKGQYLVFLLCLSSTDGIRVGCEVCGYGSHRFSMFMYSNYVRFDIQPNSRPVGAGWTRTNGVSLISFGRWARLSGSSMILAISTVTKSWYAAHFLQVGKSTYQHRLCIRLKRFSAQRKVMEPYRSLVGVAPLRWKTATGTYHGWKCWRNTKRGLDERRTTSSPKSSIPSTT